MRTIFPIAATGNTEQRTTSLAGTFLQILVVHLIPVSAPPAHAAFIRAEFFLLAMWSLLYRLTATKADMSFLLWLGDIPPAE